MSNINRKLYLATHNTHKVDELSDRLAQSRLNIRVLAASEVTAGKEWLENGASFAANALIKAKFVRQFTQDWIIADDSGLQVAALGGEPGIYSSRYAGQPTNHDANNLKLLQQLEKVAQGKRQAEFITCLCLLSPSNQEHYFYGRLEGRIADEAAGKAGFGYDPIFIPDNYQATLAELGPDVKNNMSHRSNAVDRFVQFAESMRCFDH